mgnify:CR=1 FL=1
MNNIQNTYALLNQQLAQSKKLLKSKNKGFSLVRLVVALFGLWCLYQAVISTFWLWPFLAFCSLVFFLFLVKKHDGLKKELSLTEAKIEMVVIELGYLKGNLPTQFEQGAEFVESAHGFAHDLDLFGVQSFFHHINRTFTLRGKLNLAEKLKHEDLPTSVAEQQKALKELANLPEWCIGFRARGHLLEDDQQLNQKLANWLKRTTSLTFLSHPLLLIPLASLAILLLLHWLWQPTLQHFYWFFYSFLGNLVITFSSAKAISRQYKALNNLAKPLFGISHLLKHLEQQRFKSGFLQRWLNPLQESGQSPSQSLYKLGKIVNAFDQLNNPVALLFLNGLMHYHLHSLRKLQQWKQNHQTQLGHWLAILAELEAQVSMATYAANHPQFSYPQILEEPGFRAEALGHPLLSADKAVCNHLELKDWRYGILTGSNMSGKSTFLKTVGLSLVMAQIGLPVFARTLAVFPFRIFTSMKLVDSITKEESYFQAEVLRLRYIKEQLQAPRPAFILLDEILRGTNSDDKKHGTQLFMEQLMAVPHYGLLATHDIDIAELSESHPSVFTALYFESKVVQGKLVFDYKLRKGVCTTPNATDLMRSYGII